MNMNMDMGTMPFHRMGGHDRGSRPQCLFLPLAIPPFKRAHTQVQIGFERRALHIDTALSCGLLSIRRLRPSSLSNTPIISSSRTN